ncbi:MAG: hypothetical protein ACYC9S_10850, partial [Leptospirales bacterium]
MGKKIRRLIAGGIGGFLTLFLLSVAYADDVSKGMGILQNRCSSCHNLTGPAPATLHALWSRKGPDLFYAGNKFRKSWLVSWLQKPDRIRPAGEFYVDHIKPGPDHDVVDESTLKPHVALTKEEAMDVAA